MWRIEIKELSKKEADVVFVKRTKKESKIKTEGVYFLCPSILNFAYGLLIIRSNL